MTSNRGRVFDTYVAALQHELVDLPDAAARVGVVRRPTRWLHPHIDENLQALGPSEELLDAFQSRQAELEKDGLADAAAHNQAWQDVEYDTRYEAYLDTDPAAQAAFERLAGMLAEGRDVVLVCYENTDEKHCHRTLLRARLES